jgi:hypothetical protein
VWRYDVKGAFEEVSNFVGIAEPTKHVLSFGGGFFDYDNDGNLEMVVANNGGTGNHFINLMLVGTKSNRDAMGARIRLRLGGLTQIREISGGGSYLSQSDLRAHFGLRRYTRAETVEVWRPSGLNQAFRDLEADKFSAIEEGKDRLGRQKLDRHEGKQ